MCRNISATERYLWDASNSITLSLFLLSFFLFFLFFFLGRHTWGYYSFPETSHVPVITVSKIDTIDSLQFQRGCIAFHRIRIISLTDRSLGHTYHYYYYYYYHYYPSPTSHFKLLIRRTTIYLGQCSDRQTLLRLVIESWSATTCCCPSSVPYLFLSHSYFLAPNVDDPLFPLLFSSRAGKKILSH